MQSEIYIHDIPIPSRSHKKSSHGCEACKIRKVKCDEKKPICGKFAVHFSNIEACDYSSKTKTRGKSRKPKKSTAFPQSKTRCRVDALLSAKETCTLSSTSDQEQETVSSDSQKSITALDQDAKTQDLQRECPCKFSRFTHLMLDTISGKCRNCGCQPSQHNTKHHSPLTSNKILPSGTLDPFSILPVKSSPRVHELAYHWNNTLALFPTKINSQYCTNPTWMAQAINNSTFFSVTLYISSIHAAGLRGQISTPESLFYKAQTIKLLNKSLWDPKEAVSDETLAAVLLFCCLRISCVIGEPNEAEIHLRGLRQMMNLRGGIKQYTLDGVFLHMLCIVNHLTAVLSKTPILSPASSSPSSNSYKPEIAASYAAVEIYPLLKTFAVAVSFHEMVVEILDELGYLYFVLDVFMTRFLPELRGQFEDVVAAIEGLTKIEQEKESEWVIDRLKTWGGQREMLV